MLQRLLAYFDETISKFFRLQSLGTGDENNEHQWVYFSDFGLTIGIVGVNGKIHTMLGYWSVRHYYKGNKLIRRIPVRKDLKEGERLATPEEVIIHRHEIIRKFSMPPGYLDL